MSSVILANIARHILSRTRAAAGPIVAGLAVAGLGVAQPAPSLAADEPASNAAAALPADPECLTISQTSAATYTISNTACEEQSVIASIELADGGNGARCFVKKIRTQISIASEGAGPVVNYQCIEGATGCTAEIVRDMFPECHAG